MKQEFPPLPEIRPPRSKRLLAILIVAGAIGALVVSWYLGMPRVRETPAGLPLYAGAKQVALSGTELAQVGIAEEIAGKEAVVTAEVYDVDASPKEVISWYKTQMKEKGYTENWSYGVLEFGECALWKRGNSGVLILVMKPEVIIRLQERLGRVIEVRKSMLVLLSGDWDTLHEAFGPPPEEIPTPIVSLKITYVDIRDGETWLTIIHKGGDELSTDSLAIFVDNVNVPAEWPTPIFRVGMEVQVKLPVSIKGAQSISILHKPSGKTLYSGSSSEATRIHQGGPIDIHPP